jgi:photosystem II stability/assembly factor-like uncharacterized protein
MKKRSILIKSSFAFALISLAFCIFLIKDQAGLSEREKYEQYLNGEYEKMPDCSEKERNKMAKPDRPDLAAMQNYFMIVDPQLKRVPTERLMDAYLETENIRKEINLRSQITNMQWNGTVANMGGRTRAIMYDPNDVNGNKVWAAGVTSGLWYCNDITNNMYPWIPVDDFWDNISISCIVYDPNDPQTFYLGTGEAETAVIIYRESSGVGAGIMKSTDGGQTWSILPSTQDFKYVTDIQIRDEDGTSVIYAGVVSGIYKGQVHQSLPTDGLYRSEDGGLTWQQVLPYITGLDVPYAVSEIKIGANGRIYVGSMGNVNLEGGATILYSDDGTTGTWTKYEDIKIIIEAQAYYKIPGRVVLATAPSDENRVYALFAVGFTEGFVYYRGRYIIRTDNAGETWTNLTLPDENYATLAWHALMAGVNPNDPDEVYVGGLDVWKSSNGGWNWNHLSDWALMYYGGGDDYVHADQHIALYKPGSSDEILFATDGGVFYTSNGTSAYPVFEEKNKSYNSLQFYTCAISPVSGETRYIGGLQDNGTLFYTGTPLDINDMIDGGDGAYCFWDKNEPHIFITSVYYNRYSVFLWDNYYDNAGEYSGTFICPADYDYKLNAIYANATTFFGSYADKLLRSSGIPYNISNNYIFLNTGSTVPFSHVKYSTYSPNGTATLFVGSQSGRIFKVENAHALPTVTEITGSTFPAANISCIAIGGSEDTLIVTFSNYGVTSVWQTYDGGTTWSEKQGNLPDMPVRWAIYHPDNSQQALLATEIGVWATNQLHLDDPYWEPAVDGLANVRVDMLKLRGSDYTVLAATHGRGLFTATYEYDPHTSVDELSENDLQVYPNPTSGKFRLTINKQDPGILQVKLMDMTGKIIKENMENQFTGRYIQDFDISSYAKGTYILQVTDGKRKVNRKIIFQ